MSYALDRSLPASIETERSLLGAVLLSPEFYDAASAIALSPDQFSLDSHRKIFSAVQDMREAGLSVDLITVAEELDRRKQLESVGGYAYLSSLFDAVPDKPSTRSYAKILQEKAKLRSVIHACGTAMASAQDCIPSGECAGLLTDALLQIQTESTDSPSQRLVQFTDEVYNDWERIADGGTELVGLTTGVECLDIATNGIRDGELWAVGGRTGEGKTALALQVAAANCARDIPVGLFSLEMSKGDLLQRLWSQQGQIPFQCIRNPRRISSEMRQRIRRAMSQVGLWPLYVVEDSSLSIQKLCAKARLMIRQEKIRLLVVDYAQLISAPARDERERLTKISNALRALAKDTGVPVIVISQLSRPKDGNRNARPNKYHLKESGSLENDAHVILLIYRPVDERGQATGEDELIIDKQRSGPVGSESVHFDRKTLRFFERQECPKNHG